MTTNNPIWEDHTLRDEAALWVLDRLLESKSYEIWQLTESATDSDRMAELCWEIADTFVAFRGHDTDREPEGSDWQASLVSLFEQMEMDGQIDEEAKNALIRATLEPSKRLHDHSPEPVETWGPDPDTAAFAGLLPYAAGSGLF